MFVAVGWQNEVEDVIGKSDKVIVGRVCVHPSLVHLKGEKRGIALGSFLNLSQQNLLE